MDKKPKIDVLTFAHLEAQINEMYTAWDAALLSDDAKEIAGYDRVCRGCAGFLLEMARSYALDGARKITLQNGHSATLYAILQDARAVFS